jgi:hypothetical protein
VPITLNWTGQVTQYVTFTAASGDQEETVADRNISGSVTYDPELFAHLSGPEFSWWQLSNADNLDFVQTRTSWQNGLFVPNPAGETRNDSFRAIDEQTPFGQDPATDSLSFQDQAFDGTIVEQLQLGFLGADMLGAGGSNPSPFTIPSSLGVYGFGSLFWRSGPFWEGSGYRVTFNIDSLSLAGTSVSEPGGLALMILGLLGVTLHRAHRRVGPKPIAGFLGW